MKIRLTEKCKPFSHEVGTSLLIPQSAWKVTAYPAKIELENLMSLKSQEKHVVIPHIKAPMTQFTMMQDLDRRWVRIFGQGTQGHFSYRLVASAHEIILFLERGPQEGITFTCDGETKNLLRKEELIIPTATPCFPSNSLEKMHFGCFKKQDWSLVKRRQNIEEILPIWFELGRHIPKHPVLEVGTSSLLAACQKLVERKECDKIGASFIELFNAGFEGILSPRLIDADHLGYSFNDQEVPQEASPLVLLGEGARLIRRLLVQEKGERIAILPCLPKELHAGRFIHIDLNEHLSADLEWSKKLIRRLILHPKSDQEVTFEFQSPVETFRLRCGRRGQGATRKASDKITLKKDTLYILDRFQK